MPNGSLALCPYFITEKTTAITCEDCIREYFTAQQKQEQMQNYCCSEWEDCPHAKELSQLYDTESGKPKDQIRKLELYNRSKASEITRIKRRMGKQRSEMRQMERDTYAMKHRMVRMSEETERIRAKLEESKIVFREKERGLYALIGTMLTRFSSADEDDVFSLDEIREYGQKFDTSYEIVQGQGAIKIIIVAKEDAEDDADRRSSGEVSEAGEGEARGTAEDEDIQST